MIQTQQLVLKFSKSNHFTMKWINYIHHLRYSCSDTNNAFESSDGVYYLRQKISCEKDGTWSSPTPDPCVPATCTNPPIPDHHEYKIKIIWNKDFPPLVGESVKYTCDAGGKFNRRADGIDTADYYLECMAPEKYEEPEW